MPGVSDVVRAVESLSVAASLGGTVLLGIDTNTIPEDWTHITKVDPENEKQLPLAYPLYLRHTSAVSVGGSRDVTDRNTEETFDLVNAADVPAFHEPSAAEHVTDRTRDQADFLAVPEVLNGDVQSLIGTLGEGIEHVREELAPRMLREKLPIPLTHGIEDRLLEFAAAWLIREAVFEAYIIMNLDSAAAREGNVTEEDLLSPAEAKQRALAAEHHLGSEVIYLEYSGTFGGEEAAEMLQAIDEGIAGARLWYGGGLDNREDAEMVLDAGADATVVGNVFHEIATEEADLARQAAADLEPDEATRTDVREWVDEAVDVGETNATAFLETIVDVPTPADRAVEYLADGIYIALQLEALADSLASHDDAVDEAVIRTELEAAETPGVTVFTDALDGEDADELATRVSHSLMGARFDTDVGDGFEATHIGYSLAE